MNLDIVAIIMLLILGVLLLIAIIGFYFLAKEVKKRRAARLQWVWSRLAKVPMDGLKQIRCYVLGDLDDEDLGLHYEIHYDNDYPLCFLLNDGGQFFYDASCEKKPARREPMDDFIGKMQGYAKGTSAGYLTDHLLCEQRRAEVKRVNQLISVFKNLLNACEKGNFKLAKQHWIKYNELAIQAYRHHIRFCDSLSEHDVYFPIPTAEEYRRKEKEEKEKKQIEQAVQAIKLGDMEQVDRGIGFLRERGKALRWVFWEDWASEQVIYGTNDKTKHALSVLDKIGSYNQLENFHRNMTEILLRTNLPEIFRDAKVEMLNNWLGRIRARKQEQERQMQLARAYMFSDVLDGPFARTDFIPGPKANDPLYQQKFDPHGFRKWP